jgi:hypothetical protein
MGDGHDIEEKRARARSRRHAPPGGVVLARVAGSAPLGLGDLERNVLAVRLAAVDRTHAGYVKAVAKAAAKLEERGFLLREDVQRFIAEAQSSDVCNQPGSGGKCNPAAQGGGDDDDD